MTRGRITNGSRWEFATETGTGGTRFGKPVDNIGQKSIPDYAGYANQFIRTIDIPGCTAGTGRIFVGQRRESFAVNLGDVVVHLFRPEVRSFYNLERMWAFGEAPAAA